MIFVEIASTTTQAAGGSTYFLIDVLDRAADPVTGEVCRKGGAAGETVTFALCGVVAGDQHGTWTASTLVHLDLNMTGSCAANAPVLAARDVAIRRSDDAVQLMWPHIALDAQGNPIDAARYDIWRNTSPYFTPAGDPYGSVLPEASAQGGEPIRFTDNNTPLGGAGTYYSVQAVSAIGQPSADSKRVGIFSSPPAPGGFCERCPPTLSGRCRLFQPIIHHAGLTIHSASIPHGRWWCPIHSTVTLFARFLG